MTGNKQQFCKSCGASAAEGARFCSSCGASLNLVSPYRAPTAAGSAEPTAWPSTGRTASDLSIGSGFRFGFGFAAGVSLFSAVVGLATFLLVFVLGALWLRGPSTPLTETGQRIDGIGSTVSQPFPLDGTYRLEWTAAPTTPSACHLAATLKASQGTFTYPLVDAPIESGPTPRTGSTDLGAPAGSYTVEVNSGCQWSLRFVKQ